VSPKSESTIALPQSRIWPQVKIGGLLGYTLIWAFFGIFLIYPLIRLFYDTFTTEQGSFTLMNFYDFFTDSYYLQSLVNSLLLGVATVMTTSILGITIAFLLLRYEFPGRSLFSYLMIIPMICPLVGVMGLCSSWVEQER
jgi:iron(III) transport system permease protein